MLGDWFVSLYGLELVTNVGNEILFSDGKVLGTTLGALDDISLGKYDGTVLKYSEISTERIAEVKFEGFFIGA